jgi:hypothetical protein
MKPILTIYSIMKFKIVGEKTFFFFFSICGFLENLGTLECCENLSLMRVLIF